MADLSAYEDLNDIELSHEVKQLMELFAECWDECRATDCSECKFRHGKKHYRMLLCMSERYAEKLISNDVAPVRHGRWILVDTDEEQFFICSECENKEYWESDYCPNCGAKMDEEETI